MSAPRRWDDGRRQPLVQPKNAASPLSHENIQVNPLFRALRQDVSLMIELAYDEVNILCPAVCLADPSRPYDLEDLSAKMERRDRTQTQLSQSVFGWRLQTFVGRTGVKNLTQDVPGFIALSASHHIAVISFHGSRCDEDWETNGDFASVDQSRDTLRIPNFGAGHLHCGFLRQYIGCRTSLQSELRQMIRQERIDMSKLQILVTGHSLGSAMGQLACFDLSRNLLPELGLAYPTANAVWGWFLSPPSVSSDVNSRRTINQVVGKQNMIRQQVHHDPVPKLSPHPSASESKDGTGWVHWVFNSTQHLVSLHQSIVSGTHHEPETVGYLAVQSSLATCFRSYSVSGTSGHPVVRFASGLHYGSTSKDPTGKFEVALVDLQTDRLLTAGLRIELASEEEQGAGARENQPGADGFLSRIAAYAFSHLRRDAMMALDQLKDNESAHSSQHHRFSG